MVQLPDLNTPQFEWVRSRLPHRAQPVPPIYQTEVAARAIVWAAAHAPRELRVGRMTWAAIILHKFVPGLIDRRLAARGYNDQQTSEPELHERPDNLWNVPTGDPGAHGRFGGRSKTHSGSLWAAIHVRTLLIVFLGFITLFALIYAF